MASIFNFFNPVIWIFYRRFIKYAEYACDYSVCMSENGLHEYYETIFNLAVRNNLYDMLSASLYENKSSLRERMEHVMKSYNVKKRLMAVQQLY
ncbi:MAG: M56 family metallopeptidase [Lachnospira eligens]